MATVEERMSADVSAVRPDTTLVEAARRMRVSGVGAIAVLGSEGDCGGILTERDIVVRVLAEERDARAVFVRDVATMDPATCSPGEEVAAATERMREREVQHLPVCENGKVVGVLSLADVVFGRPDEERGTVEPPSATSR
jgi:signal-transduction protein with cAMP-binding, CBS, and nucleotidyltransferase domain